MPSSLAHHGDERDQGFVVLLVLWALVPLSLIFLTLTVTARSESQETADLRTVAMLEAEADGAINTAIFELLADDRSSTSAQTLTLPAATVSIDVAALSGMVNPNTASPTLLRALMDRLGEDDAVARWVAGAVVDWRTPGQRTGANGAKAREYRAAGLDYGPPGAPFESVDELGLVRGMTPRLLRALSPYLNLYAYGDPDPQTAAPPVRMALRDLGIYRSAGRPRTQVTQITATARGNGDARATRRAVVRIEPLASRRTWRVLTWDTVVDR